MNNILVANFCIMNYHKFHGLNKHTFWYSAFVSLMSIIKVSARAGSSLKASLKKDQLPT